jgi:inositol-phosphate transport system permease protein
MATTQPVIPAAVRPGWLARRRRAAAVAEDVGDWTYAESWRRLLFVGLLTLPLVVGYVWITIFSFADSTRGIVPYVDGKPGVTLEKWSILRDSTLWKYTFNTLLLAGCMTIGIVFVSCLAGYALSRLAFPGRNGMLATLLALHAFPSFTLLIAIFFILRRLADLPLVGSGLPYIGGIGYDTLGGVILVSITLQIPLGVWLMKGFFDGVSWDMERAALVDGCSRFQAWWRVVLPQIQPGIMALSVFSFIIGWGSFILPYTYILSNDHAVLSTYLYSLLGQNTYVDYGRVIAVGVFQLMPVLLFFLFMQKYLLRIFAGGSRGGV